MSDINKSSNISDILKSVRNIIDNHDSSKLSEEEKVEDEDIVELTTVVESNADEVIPTKIRQQASAEIEKFAKMVEKEKSQDNSFQPLIEKLVKPLIKDWMDHNLGPMVEKILKEEIKKIIPK